MWSPYVTEVNPGANEIGCAAGASSPSSSPCRASPRRWHRDPVEGAAEGSHASPAGPGDGISLYSYDIIISYIYKLSSYEIIYRLIQVYNGIYIHIMIVIYDNIGIWPCRNEKSCESLKF